MTETELLASKVYIKSGRVRIAYSDFVLIVDNLEVAPGMWTRLVTIANGYGYLRSLGKPLPNRKRRIEGLPPPSSCAYLKLAGSEGLHYPIPKGPGFPITRDAFDKVKPRKPLCSIVEETYDERHPR